MPLPEDFNVLRLMRGEYPEASLTMHLFLNELMENQLPTLGSFQEPTQPGYQPVEIPLPAVFQLEPKTFGFGKPDCLFTLRDLQEDVTVEGGFIKLHWLDEAQLFVFDVFYPRPVFKAPKATIKVNASCLYAKSLNPPVPPQ